MTIVYRKDLRLNGNNPVVSFSYGAFGSLINTNFQTHLLSYVSLGGVLVYPHIRGGGAKGKKWHDAGKKTTKHNSWKDLISCIDFLIENNYTNKDKVTLYGRSAGTIPIAMAVNERPDLAKVMVLESGLSFTAIAIGIVPALLP
jgi:prolyl oligopeptidase